MRFHSAGPSIPNILLERCDAGRVVFLCGAGVSLPSGMPSFIGLTQHVIEFFAPPADSEILTAFLPWLDSSNNQSAGNVPLDQIFNLLHYEYGKDEVNALVTERLSAGLNIKNWGREHNLIKRISSNQRGVPQIVTTNFDRLFEAGQPKEPLAFHVPPAFPDLNFGSTIEGITYLHGRLVEAGAENHPYVLSSADFGRAYLSEGWATNFIRHLLERYTVVLVGYKAEDPPIKYLLQGLNHDGQYDRSKLYAFDRGITEEIEAKWRDRGVTAIAYSDHPDLWTTMEFWADRADDPRKWRSAVIAKCHQSPKDMDAHERGQVAHVLSTVQGARLFADAVPTPHPEWVCVLDANVRSAKQSSSYGENSEVFDPWIAYALDDDVKDISEDARQQGIGNDNFLVWRNGDNSPHDCHRFGGGIDALPNRLSHLITWISKSIESPVLAWWAIRQHGLHPQLLRLVERQLNDLRDLNKRARHIWNLILEHHRDPRTRQWNGEWFDWKNRLDTEGWNASILRDFRRIATPRLEIKRPNGLGQSKPPSVPWDKIQLGHLGEFEVVFLDRHKEDLDIPDDVLPQVFSILEDQLLIGAGILKDIDTAYFETPSCYPEDALGEEADITNSAKAVIWFRQLFDRMSERWPEMASAHALTWPSADQFFFSKLKLYALSKANLFEAESVATEVLSLSPEIFWNSELARELLFLLVARWREFRQATRERLTDRILAGPIQLTYHSDEEFPRMRDEYVARYARYLELNEVELPAAHSTRLAGIIKKIPEWSNDWATSTARERGIHGGWVGTDEKPDALLNLPASEIVAKAREESRRDFESLSDRRPFTGLVKSDPRRALSALTIAGKNNDYPTAFWSSMLIDLPSDIAPRLRRVFLNRIARLPDSAIVELSQTLGQWLEKNLVTILDFDYTLGWALYDRIIDAFMTAGADATKSCLGEVHQGGKVIQQSRRTFNHAINAPNGKFAAALFRAVPGGRQDAGSLIPAYVKTRFERLLTVQGEGSDHAVSIASSKLNWLMFVDPAWTQERLIPMLAFDHPASEPAWNGFLNGGKMPSAALVAVIKPLLVHLFPWIERFSWDRDLSKVAAQWLGFIRMSRADEHDGLSRAEMRSALRAMSDETRNRFIFWLRQVGQRNEHGWGKYVIPLINEVWPRERQYRTSASMRAWIALLDDTGDSFPAVYTAVKKYLVPVETNDHLYYRFTRETNSEKSISTLFPEVTLDLMDTATPQVLTLTPYELPKVLAIIVESKPELISDPRYLRLIELVERS